MSRHDAGLSLLSEEGVEVEEERAAQMRPVGHDGWTYFGGSFMPKGTPSLLVDVAPAGPLF